MPCYWTQLLSLGCAVSNCIFLKRINELIKDIERNGLSNGTGKPEPLKYRKAWSRRIDRTNRLIYNFDENKNLLIISCKGHYED